jgi:thioredoxin reductase (NADPH)
VTERVEPIRLDEAQRERLRKMGRAREVEAGEVLFRAGDETTDFFVVESGAVTIVQGLGAENRVIAVHGEGRFRVGTGRRSSPTRPAYS